MIYIKHNILSITVRHNNEIEKEALIRESIYSTSR